MLDLLLPPRRMAASADRWWPTGGRIRTTAGATVDEDLALTYAAVWCATRVISETVASLPLFMYERRPRDNRELATDNPLFDLVHSMPNPTTTSMVFREGRVGHQVNWGNAFAEIERDGEQVIALWPIHPSRVRPVNARDVDRRGRPLSGFTYVVRNNDNTEMALRSDEMLHVPGVFSEDSIWGKGVIAYARESVGFGLSTEQHGAAFFGSGAQPRGVFKGPGFRDPESRRLFRQEWKEIHGRPDAGEIAIIPVESDYKQISLTNEDSQFLETRKHNVTEIARWYRLPPHMLMDLERSTFSNIEHQGIEFVIYSLMPWLKRWEQQLALKLLTEEDRKQYFFEHQLLALLRGDINSRMSAYQTALDRGIMTVNEVRRLENLNDIGEAGDMHLIQLNMTTLEAMLEQQQAEEDPAQTSEDPALPGEGNSEGMDPIDPGQDDAGDQSGEDDATTAAVRAVLVDTLGRMLTREAQAARRAVAGRSFDAWLVEHRGKHADHILGALIPIHGLLGLVGIERHSAEIARDLIEATCQALREGYDTWTPKEMENQLVFWSRRAEQLADQILKGESIHA